MVNRLRRVYFIKSELLPDELLPEVPDPEVLLPEEPDPLALLPVPDVEVSEPEVPMLEVEPETPELELVLLPVAGTTSTRDPERLVPDPVVVTFTRSPTLMSLSFAPGVPVLT